MESEITLTLPDHVFQRAKSLSNLIGKDVEDTLALMLSSSLPPLISELDQTPIEQLSDERLPVLADSIMDETLSSRMSMLQYKQQARLMTPGRTR